jgi:hypothetical protein
MIESGNIETLLTSNPETGSFEKPFQSRQQRKAQRQAFRLQRQMPNNLQPANLRQHQVRLRVAFPDAVSIAAP